MEARKIVSIDTECVGLDFFHGVKPYLVTTCSDDGSQRYWEWDVNPYTRQPIVPHEDILEIEQLIRDADIIALHNSKFDAHALLTIGIELPWPKVRDTLLAGHLLGSNLPHNLTDMAIQYLDYDIEPLEHAVREATVRCRQIVKRELPDWRRCEEGQADMPSVDSSSKRDEDKPWKADMWMTRAYINHAEVLNLPLDDEMLTWGTVTADYANGDTAVTLPLWMRLEQLIHERGLWKIYQERLRLLPIAFNMEERGVTILESRTRELYHQYNVEVAEATDHLVKIAADHKHELEVGKATNDSLREMFYGSTRLVCPRCGTEHRIKEWTGERASDGDLCPRCLKRRQLVRQPCKVVRNKCLGLEYVYNPKSKSSNPTLDKSAMDHYEAVLDDGPAREFVTTLKGLRSRTTALGFMDAYMKFWIPQEDGRYLIHANFNITGTDTLRWSSNNPNAQQISKKEGFNLRYCFGPASGREWWSMDAKNIELRIPAYLSGEKDLIALFERSKEPPFYGSQHLLNFSVVYDDIWQSTLGKVWDLDDPNYRHFHGKVIDESMVGLYVKTRYESKWYQWVKNGDFAIQYNCGERTADRAFHRAGSFRRLKSRFNKLEALNQACINKAHKLGWVETVPDKSIDPERGYPILVSRREDGRVKDTTPLNYVVSGTAMQWTNRAMVRCEDQLREWNRQGWDGHIAIQVHDEIVYDMPRGTGDKPWLTNLPRAQRLKALMEQGGEDIGLPTPVSVEWHGDTWATGMAL